MVRCTTLAVTMCQTSDTDTVTSKEKLVEKLQYGEELVARDKQKLVQVLVYVSF